MSIKALFELNNLNINVMKENNSFVPLVFYMTKIAEILLFWLFSADFGFEICSNQLLLLPLQQFSIDKWF